LRRRALHTELEEFFGRESEDLESVLIKLEKRLKKNGVLEVFAVIIEE
jgi:hypothetical protein